MSILSCEPRKRHTLRERADIWLAAPPCARGSLARLDPAHADIWLPLQARLDPASADIWLPLQARLDPARADIWLPLEARLDPARADIWLAPARPGARTSGSRLDAPALDSGHRAATAPSRQEELLSSGP